MSTTYSNVDGSANPDHAVTDQERVDSWPQIQAYKRRTYELLVGMSPVLDVGCGPGLDAVALGKRAIGLDPSDVMCSRSRSRGCDVIRGDRWLSRSRMLLVVAFGPTALFNTSRIRKWRFARWHGCAVRVDG